MKLDRPVVFLDVESTGVDPVKDRIIQLGVAVLGTDLKPSKSVTKLFNPGMPIPVSATAVHHITDAMVKDCPPFSSFAPGLSKALVGKDLAGYNLNRLDLPMLDEEMRRCDLRLNMDGVRVIDVQAIYFKKKPRSLDDCVREYCGREPEGSHDAGVDALNTLDAFLGQMRVYPELDSLDINALADFAHMGDHQMADIAGKLYRDQEGYLRYNFGKHRDQVVLDEPGFARWMLSKDFPGSTCDVLRAELKKLDG